MPDALVRVVAIRHGQTVTNAAGLLTGRLDPPLTELGRAQAAALGAVAAGPFDLRVHSGARRAEETLRLACAAAGLPDAELSADPRWLERSFGELEGEPWECWIQPPDLDAAAPGGESYRAMAVRVLAALDDLRAQAAAAPGGRLDVLICAHSGTLRVLSAIAADPEDLAWVTAPGNGNGETVELTYAASRTPRFLSSSAAS